MALYLLDTFSSANYFAIALSLLDTFSSAMYLTMALYYLLDTFSSAKYFTIAFYLLDTFPLLSTLQEPFPCLTFIYLCNSSLPAPNFVLCEVLYDNSFPTRT